jgi:hypothetical protein
MPRFVVPVENLPPPNKNGDQLFRFRIISQDQNRISQYSPLYVVQSKGQIFPLESEAVAELTSSGSIINVTWETPSIYNVGPSAVGASVLHNHEGEWKIHDSDIFVKWMGSGLPDTYEYYGRSRDNEISIIRNPSASAAIIVGDVANYDELDSRQPNPIFTIFSVELSLV